MGILLWLIKPALYVVLLWVAAARLRREFPEKVRSPALVGILGAIARTGLGAAVAWGLVQAMDGSSKVAFYSAFFAAGAAMWLAVTAVAFRGVPFARILVIAAIGELLSGSIDTWALHDMQSIHIC